MMFPTRKNMKSFECDESNRKNVIKVEQRLILESRKKNNFFEKNDISFISSQSESPPDEKKNEVLKEKKTRRCKKTLKMMVKK